MHVLVLDTIHGGKAIGEAFAARGDHVDCVDVYRGQGGIEIKTALTRDYDLVVAPVHLDPDHPLLHFSKAPVITHHEAVHQILDGKITKPMIEITGAKGKTTTAHALAFLMAGNGILHTSSGTYLFPEKRWLSRSSITPGSVLAADKSARDIHGWLIVEESLGITCLGNLGIITSDADYSFAAGKKSALASKIASAKECKNLILAKNIHAYQEKNVVHMEDVARCEGIECTIILGKKISRFSNPLLAIPGYQTSLVLAAVAAMILGVDPSPLSSFTAVPGRMSVSYERELLVIDNANSGTNLATTLEAAHYVRSISGKDAITLVIGQEEGDGAVCEGFSIDQIKATIDQIRPAQVVWVGRVPEAGLPEFQKSEPFISACTTTLKEAYDTALAITGTGSIVLAVKTWR
jgi:UDP-N-acetylmuramoylalanine-D-glutamate ligase